jgi:ADP-dependent NAD(P)H-hydrate dehydratase / NAD(P)H-hydrate epimerase
MNSREQLEQVVVTAEQMRQIEARIFAAGMPVAALMEKAALLMATRIQQLYPLTQFQKVGILIGPGHNGGDALVVARELHLAGYRVVLYRPFPKLKDLTAQHAQYAESLGIPFSQEIQALHECELIIDGLFGFGLERSLSGEIADAIEQLNRWSKPTVSIDIPSGLHTDTGEVLGTAVRATNTLCLGLWKRAFFQDSALEYIGKAQRIDFGIQESDAQAILAQSAPIRQMISVAAKQYLPIPRPPVTHKYKQGHLLLICGSRRYAGGAILTGLGARASGVGMLSIAVPESLKPILTGHLPDALVIDCPETADFSKYTLIACGPGLTPEAQPVVEAVLKAECPVILDADGLNILAQLGTIATLSQREAPTILTPHLGEFKRLFPEIENPDCDRITAVQKAAAQSRAIVLFKGARTAIAHPQGSVWLIGESTPALARGGSGDVLTGLMGGLLAQTLSMDMPLEAVVATAAWWHSQAGILAAKERTEIGVDAFTLSQYLNKFMSKHQKI